MSRDFGDLMGRVFLFFRHNRTKLLLFFFKLDESERLGRVGRGDGSHRSIDNIVHCKHEGVATEAHPSSSYTADRGKNKDRKRNTS